jgi:hypothetical protein
MGFDVMPQLGLEPGNPVGTRLSALATIPVTSFFKDTRGVGTVG